MIVKVSINWYDDDECCNDGDNDDDRDKYATDDIDNSAHATQICWWWLYEHLTKTAITSINNTLIDLLLSSTSTSTATITTTTTAHGSIQHRPYELLQASECIIIIHWTCSTVGRSLEMEKANWLAAELVTGWWFYQRSNDEEEKKKKKIGAVSGELALSGCVYRQITLLWSSMTSCLPHHRR